MTRQQIQNEVRKIRYGDVFKPFNKIENDNSEKSSSKDTTKKPAIK